MKHRILFAALLLCCTALTLNAQDKPRKWKFHLDGSAVLTSGNINSINVSQGGGADRNDSILAFSGNYKYIYGEQNHLMSNRELTAGIQFDLWQYNRFSPFVAATDLINRFKGYDNKFSTLVGAKYRIYSLPGICDYSISAAFVGEFIDYYNDDEKLKTEIARLSIRAKIKQKIGPNVNLSHTTFYQPALYDFSDYSINSVTRLETTITKQLTLGAVFTYEYSSVVPAETKNNDMRTELSLRFNF